MQQLNSLDLLITEMDEDTSSCDSSPKFSIQSVKYILKKFSLKRRNIKLKKRYQSGHYLRDLQDHLLLRKLKCIRRQSESQEGILQLIVYIEGIKASNLLDNSP